MNAVAACLALSLAAAPGPTPKNAKVQVVYSGAREGMSLEPLLRDALRKAGFTVMASDAKDSLDVLVRAKVGVGHAVMAEVSASDPGSKELLVTVVDSEPIGDATDTKATVDAATALSKRVAEKLVQELAKKIDRREVEGRSIDLTVRGVDDFGIFNALKDKLRAVRGVKDLADGHLEGKVAMIEVQAMSAEALAEGLSGVTIKGRSLNVMKVTGSAVEVELGRKR